MTRKNQKEYVSVLYGIDGDFNIVSIWINRGNEMFLTKKDGTQVSHYILSGRTAQSEALIVFGVSDTFQVLPNQVNDEFTKSGIEELKKIAEERKLAKAKI